MFYIRKANADDAESLYILYLQHLTQSPPKEDQDLCLWREKLDRFAADDRYHLLVSECDGKVVCSVTLILIENLTHNVQPYAVMENVVTHADYRNRGFASALIRHAFDIAQQHGCYKVMLMTSSKEEGIWRFYRSCGFDQNEKTAFIKRF